MEFKEFWLDPLLSPRNSIYTEASESCIHVIEKSALDHQATHYESKIAELENVLKEMVKVRYGLQGYVEDDDLQGERDYLAGLLFGPDGHETKARQALKDLAEWRNANG